MKILVAGATGAIGKQLIPRLVAGGHDVVGMARNESRLEAVRSLGATAADEGDLGALETLLAHDVVLRGDGGGKAPAAAQPLLGRSRVARALVGWMKGGLKVPGTSLRRIEVNGQPGAVALSTDGKLVGVMALDIAEQQVRSVVAIVNPDKLQHLGPVGDLGALLRGPTTRDRTPSRGRAS